MSAPNLLGGSPHVIDFATQSFSHIEDVFAETERLLLDFDIGSGAIVLQGPGPANFWCLSVSMCIGGRLFDEQMGFIDGVPNFLSEAQSGLVVFAEVSAVPVPAAIWLFGTALIGFIGFSKRRKAA